MVREWKDNAFWDNDSHTIVKAILIMNDEDGRESSQVLTVAKTNPDGSPNLDWVELMEQVGADKITANTEERATRKAEEAEKQRIQEEQREKAHQLEKLFNAKIQAFEVEEIKNSDNRKLKSRLRRAKSVIEVNLFAMMIVMEQLENESDSTD